MKYIFLLLFFVLSSFAIACDCPHTSLSMDECNKYELIFKGKITNVKMCNNNFGEAMFTIEELYKGNATKEFKVLFECGGECFQKLSIGDEWIIYSNYKQLNNVLLDWCSRSRKFFQNPKEDFYTVLYGNDYFDEIKFLQKELGNHRVLTDVKNGAENRNIRPTTTQTIVILLVSIACIVLFYFLFNKFFKLK